jgi:hypothetical protein
MAILRYINGGGKLEGKRIEEWCMHLPLVGEVKYRVYD